MQLLSSKCTISVLKNFAQTLLHAILDANKALCCRRLRLLASFVNLCNISTLPRRLFICKFYL